MYCTFLLFYYLNEFAAVDVQSPVVYRTDGDNFTVHFQRLTLLLFESTEKGKKNRVSYVMRLFSLLHCNSTLRTCLTLLVLTSVMFDSCGLNYFRYSSVRTGNFAHTYWSVTKLYEIPNMINRSITSTKLTIKLSKEQREKRRGSMDEIFRVRFNFGMFCSENLHLE